jgi:hypothetical protein
LLVQESESDDPELLDSGPAPIGDDLADPPIVPLELELLIARTRLRRTELEGK